MWSRRVQIWDDVAIVINLLKPRINLRIAYSGIDIDVRDVEDDEVETNSSGSKRHFSKFGKG